MPNVISWICATFSVTFMYPLSIPFCSSSRIYFVIAISVHICVFVCIFSFHIRCARYSARNLFLHINKILQYWILHSHCSDYYYLIKRHCKTFVFQEFHATYFPQILGGGGGGIFVVITLPRLDIDVYFHNDSWSGQRIVLCNCNVDTERLFVSENMSKRSFLQHYAKLFRITDLLRNKSLILRFHF